MIPINMNFTLKEFYNIKREPEENMADYIRKYERVARELKTASRGEIAEEVRGWHLLGQSRVGELEEQVVSHSRRVRLH